MKKFLLLPFFFLLLITAFFPRHIEGASASAPEGISLSERITTLEREAEAGDSAAMYHLSTLYHRGYDTIAPDSVRAMRLLQSAARKGHVAAMNRLGYFYLTLHGVYSPDSALYWLHRAAAAGDPTARYNLAFLVVGDTTAPAPRLAEAVNVLREATDRGMPQAAATLADLYRTGRGVARDTLTAEMFYLQARSAGLEDAELKLMVMNRDRYSRLSPAEALTEGLRAAHAGAHVAAFRLFSRAAEDSIPRALALLGEAYASAKGTDYNHEKSTGYFLKAALGGDPSARFILAETLEIFPDALSKAGAEERSAVSEEMNTPQYWYHLAAEDGVTDAETALKRLFDNTFATPSNFY